MQAAYERKMYRYKAKYSLDCENGIENAVLLKPQTPDASGGKTVSGAGLCRCDEAAGETGKANLCPILSGNDGKMKLPK